MKRKSPVKLKIVVKESETRTVNTANVAISSMCYKERSKNPKINLWSNITSQLKTKSSKELFMMNALTNITLPGSALDGKPFYKFLVIHLEMLRTLRKKDSLC